MTTVAPPQPYGAGVAPPLPAGLATAGGRLRVLRHVAMPVVLAGICLWLYLYVTRRQLDSIEEIQLNAPYIRERLWEHISLALAATAVVIAIAVPLGIMLTRPLLRRLTPLMIGFANIAQAIPSVGLVVFFALTIGIGFRPALYALVAHSALAVLRNTMVGLDQVDRSLIEAGRGMGMTKFRVLARIEMPLAVPVILAGVRTALILNVGTATLGTFINAGTLGDLIHNGLNLGRDPVIITGAVLTTVLALTIDWIAGVAEDVLRPKGL